MCLRVHHLSCPGLVVQDGLHAATGRDALREHGDDNVHTERFTSLRAGKAVQQQDMSGDHPAGFRACMTMQCSTNLWLPAVAADGMLLRHASAGACRRCQRPTWTDPRSSMCASTPAHILAGAAHLDFLTDLECNLCRHLVGAGRVSVPATHNQPRLWVESDSNKPNTYMCAVRQVHRAGMQVTSSSSTCHLKQEHMCTQP